jgi:hypothetical protein
MPNRPRRAIMTVDRENEAIPPTAPGRGAAGHPDWTAAFAPGQAEGPEDDGSVDPGGRAACRATWGSPPSAAAGPARIGTAAGRSPASGGWPTGPAPAAAGTPGGPPTGQWTRLADLATRSVAGCLTPRHAKPGYAYFDVFGSMLFLISKIDVDPNFIILLWQLR